MAIRWYRVTEEKTGGSLTVDKCGLSGNTGQRPVSLRKAFEKLDEAEDWRYCRSLSRTRKQGKRITYVLAFLRPVEKWKRKIANIGSRLHGYRQNFLSFWTYISPTFRALTHHLATKIIEPSGHIWCNYLFYSRSPSNVKRLKVTKINEQLSV